jgi:hypothetical protein
MDNLTPDQKVRLQLEKSITYDAQSRAIRDQLFKNAPQLATIGPDGRIKMLSGDDAPAEFMPNLYYGQGEIVDYTPVQGGLGKADKKSFIGAAQIATPANPIFPEGSETGVFFDDDRLFVQLDGLEGNLSFASNILGGGIGFGYLFLDANPSVIRFENGSVNPTAGDYSAIMTTSFPSGNLTGYMSLLVDPPYTVWKVELNCQDGYALTPSCENISLNGLRIEIGATYELQGIVNLNGSGFVDFHTMASAVATDNGLGVGVANFDKPSNTINTIGEGDATLSCAAIGLTTVEWAWKWRKQGEDWFVL